MQRGEVGYLSRNKKHIVCLIMPIVALMLIGVRSCEQRDKGEYVYSDNIDIDALFLNKLTDQEIRMLKRYLAGNANWSLVPRKGFLEAEYRFEPGGILGGREFEKGSLMETGGVQISKLRISLFLDQEERIYDPLETQVQAAERRVRIKMCLPNKDGQPWYESRLLIVGENVSILFTERSMDVARMLTRESLDGVRKEFAALLGREKELFEKGYLPGVVYGGSIIDSTEPMIEVRDGPQPGMYAVVAYVNPHEEGYAYLRVIDTLSEDIIYDESISEMSKEYIGWADDSAVQFRYEQSVVIYSTGEAVDAECNARFELWFHPTGDGADCKLVQTTKPVLRWER